MSNQTLGYYAAIERLNNENVKIIILFLADTYTIPDIQVAPTSLYLSSLLLDSLFSLAQILPKAILLLLPNIDVVIVRNANVFPAYPYLLLSPSNWWALSLTLTLSFAFSLFCLLSLSHTRPVPILNTDPYGVSIGYAHLEFDALGRLNALNGSRVKLTSAIPMDPAVQARWGGR